MKVTQEVTSKTTYDIPPEESVALVKAGVDAMLEAALDPKKHAAVIAINQQYANAVREACISATEAFFAAAPQSAANMWLAGMKLWGFTK